MTSSLSHAPGRANVEGRSGASIRAIRAAAFRIPTDSVESDGTFTWDATTLVVVEAEAGDEKGLGYSYTDRSAVTLIEGVLAPVVNGRDTMAVAAEWTAMRAAVRNMGATGIAASAIAAVDTALWDLKARLLGLPLATLLGRVRDEVPVYGSGGFTSYSIERLQRQLAGWVEQGIPRVKMKVGRDATGDPERVRAARLAIGPDAELFVDANGAYSRKQALAAAQEFQQSRVTWFEEPVPSDDLAGLRLVRDRAPAGMEIAAGEYGWNVTSFHRLLQHGAVDVLQADATRCMGISGFIEVGAMCDGWMIPLSAHTAPALHLHPCCALPALRHIEYFHDHARIESLLFDGAHTPIRGVLAPDLSRPGLGLEFKWKDAARYAV